MPPPRPVALPCARTATRRAASPGRDTGATGWSILLAVLLVVAAGLGALNYQNLTSDTRAFCAQMPALPERQALAAIDDITDGDRGEGTYSLFEAGVAAYVVPAGAQIDPRVESARADLVAAHRAVLQTRERASVTEAAARFLSHDLVVADGRFRAACGS